MNSFRFVDGELRCEGTSLSEIAEAVGTPTYVYSEAGFVRRFEAIRDAFLPLEPLVCYAVKANGNLAVLDLLRSRGAGFDVVSSGELYRTMRVDVDPQRIVFAGVGKSDEEIRYALRRRIFLFNVESEPELLRIDAIALEMGQVARCALRVNPDVDPRTHRYIATGKQENKFGVDFERAAGILDRSRSLEGIELIGLHMHIGSQLTDPEPYREALTRLLAFFDAQLARGHLLTLLNLGGGYGIDYEGEGVVQGVAPFAEVVKELMASRTERLVIEPGRSIAGPAGMLLTRVMHIKQGGKRRFVIVDAGMTTLLRPSLYGSFHRIWPVVAAAGPGEEGAPEASGRADIVGPICESGDFLALDRPFPEVAGGDLLAVFDAGAYGFAMASQYNAHPRPPEVLVSGSTYRVVRRRETFEDLVLHEVD